MSYISLISKRCLPALLLLLSLGLNAQVASNSPYSALGFGDIGTTDHGMMSGIGNSNISVVDSTILNFYNPATYCFLASGMPIFSLGESSRFSFYRNGDLDSYSPVSSISDFTFAVPFRSRFGLALGLKPYSRRGYSFSSVKHVDNDSLLYAYSGKGSINEAFVGLSAKILKRDSIGLSVAIGSNIGYLFGTVTNQRSATLFESGGINIAGGVEQRNIRAKSLHYDLGLYVMKDFGKKHTLTLSSVIDLEQDLNIRYWKGLFYAGNIDNPETYDTLSITGSADSNSRISSVPALSFGAQYTLRRLASSDLGHRLNNQWNLYLTYTTSDWSRFSVPFDSVGTRYFSTHRITCGAEFTPETQVLKTSMYKYFERMRYRIGGYYYTLPYGQGGEQVSDFGTTFGVGLPITIKGSLSSMNMGVTLGQRGTGNSALLRERYVGFNVGLLIAPVGDRWFRKRIWD